MNLRILYVTPYDSSDVHQWSGLGYYIRKAMEDQGIVVEPFQVVGGPISLSGRLARRAYSLMGQVFLTERAPEVVKNWSRQVENKARKSCPDIIFSPGTTPIAFVDTNHPLVTYGDATFDGLLNLYPQYANVCEASRKSGQLVEQAAWDRCTLAVFASDWAARSVNEYYCRPPRSISVVPFGANVECNRTDKQVEDLIDRRPSNVCRLLFAGVDWERKGGGFAVEVMVELNNRGIAATLDVVGCSPVGLPDRARVHGFVSKRNREGRQYIEQLFGRAHFLILPTRAEAYGLVFCEAASFGVPSLTNSVGGVPVVSGATGLLFPLGAKPSEWADAIAALWDSPRKYKSLASNSFAAYRETFNWAVAGRRLRQLLEEL